MLRKSGVSLIVFLVSAALLLHCIAGHNLFFAPRVAHATEQGAKEKRSVQDTWDLTRLYKNEGDWAKDVNRINENVYRLASFKGKLANETNLFDAMALEEDLSKTMEKVYVYAHLQFDTHTTDPHYQAMLDKVRQTGQNAGVSAAYLGPELVAIQVRTLHRLYQNDKRLDKYKDHIAELRKEKNHILPEGEEKLLALAGAAASNSAHTYQLFSEADLKFPYVKNERGEEIPLTKANYGSFLKSADAKVRQCAFTAMYGTYDQFKNTFASLMQGEVKQNILYAKARRYPSARNASLSSADIPDKVYDNLIQTVNRRLHLLHRYMSLHKKMLGLDAMHKYDLGLPLIKGTNKYYPFEKAEKMVHDGLAPLGQEYQQVVNKAFANRWVDVYSYPGKTVGAYQTGVYGYPPYILLNYHGTLNDVLTAAHEMGHAVHTYYADRSQPYLDSHYPIFVAEVASTVNESLLLRQWIAHSKNKQEKAALLKHYLDMFQGTLFMQTMFAEFEDGMHRAAEKGEALTAERLSAMYLGLTKKYYGPALHVDPLVGMEWARIPHFYKNFYVYQYATGFSAAIALSDGLLKGGTSRKQKYLAFLKAGGSQPPLDLLKAAGVDMADPAVINRALDVFAETLDEFEKLVNTPA
ncbi:oligoendopeptidase F [Aneurinibacillus terranovensis]|uniref:oligoendopeptidase F n=1 Tax=Aneurinibacillus terranovensis TaxID=278991 RepID=UPI0004066C13|nr:oligoendopeptidase F [Aneurinibacillus terranovensis]